MGKSERILLDIGTIDNIFDLSNFIQRVFRAEIRFFEDTNEIGMAFCASFKGIKKNLIVFVFLGGASDIYECNKEEVFLAKLFELNYFVENFLAKNKSIHHFNEPRLLVDFLKDEATEITFPDPEIIDSVKLVDLAEREKRINKWREIFFNLVPYGVVVEDKRNESETRTIFCLTLPIGPVPTDVAERNEYNDYFHGNDFIFFHPEDDWVKEYQNIVTRLNNIYGEISSPIL